MSSVNVGGVSMDTVEVGQKETPHETFLAIYNGDVETTPGTNRFSNFKATSALKGFTPTCPLMFHLCWYQSAVNEINKLLAVKRGPTPVSGVKRSASEANLLEEPIEGASSAEESKAEPVQLVEEETGHGDTAQPFRKPWMPGAQSDPFPYYAVTGTWGVGKSMFIKYYFDTLSKAKECAQDCPDVLLVSRKEDLANTSLQPDEEVYLQLLYVDGGGVARSVVVLCDLHHVPAAFWARHTKGRPLQVIVDTYLPIAVRREMFSVKKDVELFLYVASSSSRDHASSAINADSVSWPFVDNFYHVSELSRADYMACGYACATLRTREFLRNAANIKESAQDIDTTHGRLKGTPQDVQRVMEYLYEVLGGTARYLMQIGDSSAIGGSTEVCDVIMSTLKEVFGDGTGELDRAHKFVNKGCTRLLANKLAQTALKRLGVEVLQVRAKPLFFREVVEIDSLTGGRDFSFVSASCAMTAIYLAIQRDKVREVATLLKSIIS